MDCEEFIVAVIRLAYFVPSASRLPLPLPPGIAPSKFILTKAPHAGWCVSKTSDVVCDDARQLILLDVLDGCFVI